MIVEAAIFDRQDGLNHALRNGGQRHIPPLLTPFTDQRGQQRRVELDPVEPLLLADRLDRLQAAAAPLWCCRGEHEPDGLPGAIARARDHRQGISPDRELSRLFRRRTLRVAEFVETIDHLQHRDALPAFNDHRARENPWIGPLEFPVHPGIDDA